MIHRLKALASITLAGVSLLAWPAYSEDVKLPPTMAVTAYDTGTAGFNIAVGVGKMMKDKYGTDVRVLPAGNDVARLAPLRAKRAVISAMGSGTYFAQEGVFEFGAREWGPQPLQLVLSSVDCNAGSLGVAADTGVKQIKDLRGKRVGFVVGSPALNQNALAILAFGDLKQSDVKIVEFSSYGAMWKGLINNDTDNDATAGAAGLGASRQTKNWVVPVHPGAVKALKEAGQWTDDQEAHNNALFKRQAVLAVAWADYGKSSPPSDDKEFLAGWMKARAAALAKANMPNGFEE